MKKRITLLISICCLLLLLCACGGSKEQTIKSLADLSGKKVGVVIGTIHDTMISEALPEAEVVYFNAVADGVGALDSGSIDAFARSYATALFLTYENPNLAIIEESLADSDIALAFPKTSAGSALRKEFNDFLKEQKAADKITQLRDKWFAKDEAGKSMPPLPASGKNGVLTLATTGTMIPYTYVRDNGVVGLEIELAVMFAEEYGYGLRVETMNFDGVMPAVQSGKADFGAACLAITEERKESVDFSDAVLGESAVLLVRGGNAAGSGSFFQMLKENFEKTFLREQRYLLFWEGIRVTFTITVLSILFGTLLGFLVYLLCRKGGKVRLAVTRFCIWLIQGMPAIVLLMIFYYIVFAGVGIGPVSVSIISFSLVFAAAVFNMLQSGVRTIGSGQTEAAYALGFSDRKTFFKVILPQALRHILPSFKTQVTALLKATAVVGYISATDVTRVGDLIRSRTYEPFFSLIAVAVMYFIMAGLINLVVGHIERKMDPENRTKKSILKGVNGHD